MTRTEYSFRDVFREWYSADSLSVSHTASNKKKIVQPRKRERPG
jgi:hypothetical protein